MCIRELGVGISLKSCKKTMGGGDIREEDECPGNYKKLAEEEKAMGVGHMSLSDDECLER